MKKFLPTIILFCSLIFVSVLVSSCGGVSEPPPQSNNQTPQPLEKTNNANVTPLQKSSPNSANTNIPKPSPVTSPSPSPQSKARTFKGVGVVTFIDLEQVAVELDHEEIKGLMPAMKMMFFVNDKHQLEVLQIGDKVNFVIEENQGQERIIDIRKR
jgi:Cu/Ag efflux protein CusF